MAELTPDIASELVVGETAAESEQSVWSLAAMMSLACGVLLFVPFFSGAAAVALGIAGLMQTRDPWIRGRRLAIAGIVVGAVSLAGWIGYAEMVRSMSAPGRGVAKRFIADLNAGKIDYAGQECEGNIHADRLSEAADHLKNLGGVKSVAVLYITSETVNGAMSGSVRGVVQTPSGGRSFQMKTAGESASWKISEFSIQ